MAMAARRSVVFIRCWVQLWAGDRAKATEYADRPTAKSQWPTASSSAVHGNEELLVALRAFHARLHELHCFHGVHVGEVLAQDPGALQHVLVMQQTVAARAGGEDVDRGEDAAVADLPIELQFHVAGALEFFED